MSRGIYFNGKWISHPGAYGYIDAESIGNYIDGATKVCAFVGSCKGGKPGEVLWFTDPRSAKDTLKSGMLLKAVQKAFSPLKDKTSTDAKGASVIAVVRVDDATQSTLTLKDSLNTDYIKIMSKDYGELTKNNQIRVTTGTYPGSKRVIVYNWIDNKYEPFDNMGALGILRYSGAQVYAHAIITKNATGDAVRLQTKVGADAASAIVDLDIDLTMERYKTVRQLMEFVDSFSDYAIDRYTNINNALLSKDIDAVDIDIVNTGNPITAVGADIASTLTSMSRYVDAERLTKVPNTIADIPSTSLAGGSDGTIPASWSSMFDKLSPYKVDIIVPVTGDKSIHLEAQEYCKYMSETMGRERTIVCGGMSGESITDTKSRALAYNSDRISLAYPGFYDYDENGNLQLYPPYVAAGMVAGRACGKDIGQSMTLEVFDVIGLEYDLEPDEVNELLNTGVTVVEHDLDEGFRLVQDLTTLQDETSMFTERCVRELADAMNRELKKEIEKLIVGKNGTKTSVGSVKTYLISYLGRKVKDEWITGFRNPQVSWKNKVISLSYEAAPAQPTNFALIHGHFYSEDITI